MARKQGVPDFVSWCTWEYIQPDVEEVPYGIDPNHKLHQDESDASTTSDKNVLYLHENGQFRTEHSDAVRDLHSIRKLRMTIIRISPD